MKADELYGLWIVFFVVFKGGGVMGGVNIMCPLLLKILIFVLNP